MQIESEQNTINSISVNDLDKKDKVDLKQTSKKKSYSK